MPALIANVTAASIQFRALQGTVWRQITIPAASSVSTEITELDLIGKRLVNNGDLVVLSGSVGPLPPKPSATLPPIQYLDLASALRLFVKRSEFLVATARPAGTNVMSRVDLLGATGGGSTKLDGIPTFGQDNLNQILFTTFSGRLEMWQLQVWDGVTAENAEAGFVLPDDSVHSTNPRIWVLIFGV